MTTSGLAFTPQSVRNRFQLKTLGGVSLWRGGEEVKLGTRKNLALITYLALQPAARESRQRLAGLLWGNFPEDKARTSLRQSVARLTELQTADGQPLIAATRNQLALNLAAIDVDLLTIRAELEEAVAPAPLLTLVNFEDSIMAGLDEIDPGFAAWLATQRQALRAEWIRRLNALLSITTKPSEQMRISRCITNLDPTNEPACRSYMLASSQLGDFAGALRCYKDLWDLLHNEFDTEPDALTQQAVAAVKKADLQALTAVVSMTAPVAVMTSTPYSANIARGKTSSAVVDAAHIYIGAFSTLNDCSDIPAFSNILRSETIRTMTKFREWRVFDLITNPPVKAKGYHLSCDVFSEGRSLHCLMNLSERQTGRFIMSERFSATFENWLEQVQLITFKTANEVAAAVSKEQIEEIGLAASLMSLPPHSRLVRAQYALHQWNWAEENLAQTLFLSVIAEAQEMPLAHAGYAAILNAKPVLYPGQFRSPESMRLAVEHASRAASLAPDDSRNQLALAWSFALKNDPRAASTFLRALDANPADSWVSISAAEGLATLGDLKKSREVLDHFMKITGPLNETQWAYLTLINFLTGDYEGAVEASKYHHPLLNCSGGWAAAALALMGERDEARHRAQQFSALAKASWNAEFQPTDELLGAWLRRCFPVASDYKSVDEGLLRSGFAMAR